MSLKYAIGLSCLSIMTSVCPTSNGEQAVVGFMLQWAGVLQREPLQHGEPG